MEFWNESKKIIGSDVASYYTFLPAIFIYDDLKLNFYDQNKPKFMMKVYFDILNNGKKFIKTTYGLSLLYSPFFFISHAVSCLTGNPADGYTYIYKIGLICSSIFYFGLGLFFLRKILLKYYSEFSTSLTLLVAGIGTNMLHYVIVEPAMPHVYNFCLIILFIYATIKWHDKPGWLNSLLIGVIGGLIILIRPTNILVILLFVFWNINSRASAKAQFQKFIKNYYLILFIIAIGFVFWIPQFFYWHYMTGDYFFISYGDRAYFFLNDPEITNILFSYRKGWLLYTPLMIFALIGVFFLYRYNNKRFIPVLIFTFANIYLLASWCFWWFGGSFGSRGFIDSYGVMAIPMAAFFTWCFRQKIMIRLLFVIVVFILIWFNTFQVRQYYRGAIHWSDMTKKAYWETFLSLKKTKRFPSLLEKPPYNEVEKRILKAKGKFNENEE